MFKIWFLEMIHTSQLLALWWHFAEMSTTPRKHLLCLAVKVLCQRSQWTSSTTGFYKIRVQLFLWPLLKYRTVFPNVNSCYSPEIWHMHQPCENSTPLSSFPNIRQHFTEQDGEQLPLCSSRLWHWSRRIMLHRSVEKK